jgi:hypothetical protein
MSFEQRKVGYILLDLKSWSLSQLPAGPDITTPIFLWPLAYKTALYETGVHKFLASSRRGE